MVIYTIYGAVPPVADTDDAPSFPPVHFTFCITVALAESAVAGSFMVTDTVPVQPEASVEVTVYAPAARSEREAPVFVPPQV